MLETYNANNDLKCDTDVVDFCPVLAEVDLTASNENQKITRSYEKMLETLSNIGGFVGIFLGLFEILNGLHNGF